MNIRVGDSFPLFSGRTYDGHYFSVADLIGKQVVVYFYPKDDTPGCAVECREFSELLSEFRKHNTEVAGVSVDTLNDHKKFSQRYNLKVPLISDAEKTLTRQIGILRDSGLAMRTTFILDEEGRVRKIFENVNPNGHAQEVLNYIKAKMEPEPKKEGKSGRERMRKIRQSRPL